MHTPTANLNKWTTDELLTEVFSRSAGDRTALNRIQLTTMRALLDDCDQKSDRWHAEATALA